MMEFKRDLIARTYDVRIYSGYIYDAGLCDVSSGYNGYSADRRAEEIDESVNFKSSAKIVDKKLVLNIELLP